MSKYEESRIEDLLDTEFDHFLLDIKPYVLKHPNKTERQRCAVWIKKLCDLVTCGSSLKGRKNRNTHARLLLHMLRRGVLDKPFINKPEPGSLKTLPTYLSIYYDEPLTGRSVDHSKAGLPEWVTGELGDSLAGGLLWDRISSTPIGAHHRTMYEEESPSHPVSSAPLKPSPRHDARMVDGELKAHTSPDDSDLEARLNSWNLGIENPRYLREKPIPLSPIFKSSFGRNSTSADEERVQSRETEMKFKVLEAKHQEEKVKMHGRHNADVKKILDRKNGEIEEVKSMYQAKQKELEEMICKLEKKVQSMLRESLVIRESKDKQIAELKKISVQSYDSLKNGCEKKLYAFVTEMEKEKFEMQKKHIEDTQELLEDTNAKLAKMEAEYSARSQATEQTVRELELRVKQQSLEVEKGNALRQKVTQEKAQLEIHVASISAELQEANRRNKILQKEKEQQQELQEQSMQRLLVRHETNVSDLHREHAVSAAKASEVKEELEKTLANLKQQLLDSDHQRLQEVRDQGLKFLQEKEEHQMNCEKKILEIRSKAENEQTKAKRKIAKLEDALREMESQLDRAKESHRLQIQMQQSSEKTYADMKLQMEKIEEDLNRSEFLRKAQAKDAQQVDALRQKYEQQMAEQRMQHEQEMTRLQQQHSAEKDSLVQEHQREVSSLDRQARATLQQHQQHTQECRKRDAQRFSDVEARLSSLREELQGVHAQHKQQLAEMAVVQEEEKQKALLDKEASLDRLRSDMERSRSDLERSHQQEKDVAQEKTDSKLKQIEKQYRQKLAKTAQLIAELNTSMCDTKEKAMRQLQEKEKQLEEANARWDEERKTMIDHGDQTCKALQQKAESLQRQLHCSEKKLLSKELETEEKVLVVRQEYEEKIKGLIPTELRQELEDTIASLKVQVFFHQKTVSLLQEDLDACRSRRQPWENQSQTLHPGMKDNTSNQM